MSELGAVFYRGPSLLTGDPIVGVLTGLEGGSSNKKTGPMVQAYIIRSDIPPMDAKRANLDDAVCGDCKLRGRDGKNSGCYACAGGCGRSILASRDDAKCPDCKLARQQARGRDRLEAYRQRQVESPEPPVLRAKFYRPGEVRA